jgi:hypothetical protein
VQQQHGDIDFGNGRPIVALNDQIGWSDNSASNQPYGPTAPGAGIDVIAVILAQQVHGLRATGFSRIGQSGQQLIDLRIGPTLRWNSRWLGHFSNHFAKRFFCCRNGTAAQGCGLLYGVDGHSVAVVQSEDGIANWVQRCHQTPSPPFMNHRQVIGFLGNPSHRLPSHTSQKLVRQRTRKVFGFIHSRARGKTQQDVIPCIRQHGWGHSNAGHQQRP